MQEDAGYPAVATVQITNPFNQKDYSEDKLSVVDVKATDITGCHVHHGGAGNVARGVLLARVLLRRLTELANQLCRINETTAAPAGGLAG